MFHRRGVLENATATLAAVLDLLESTVVHERRSMGTWVLQYGAESKRKTCAMCATSCAAWTVVR
jgi:hypothetical protein